MRELFEICPEIQFFNYKLLSFLRFYGVNLVRKGVKQGVRNKLEKIPP